MSGPTRQHTTVARLTQRLAELPALSVVLLDLLRLDRTAADHFDRVVTLIGRDPALATRVVRAANSAALGSRPPVAQLVPAIQRLGSLTAADLAIAESMARVFVPRYPWEQALWLHAIGVAVLARALARSPLMPPADPELCYLTGLLHDIGRFVLYLEAPEELHAVDETEWETPDELIAAERRLCGFTHAELGYRVAVRWRLPPPLPVLLHHHHARPPLPPEVPPAVAPVLEVINRADRMSVASLKHPEWPRLSPAAVSAIAALVPPVPRCDAAARDALLAAAFRDIATTATLLGLA